MRLMGVRYFILERPGISFWNGSVSSPTVVPAWNRNQVAKTTGKRPEAPLRPDPDRCLR